jgi:hypothetical protein
MAVSASSAKVCIQFLGLCPIIYFRPLFNRKNNLFNGKNNVLLTTLG